MGHNSRSQGFDVHMCNEQLGIQNGAGDAVDELVSAVQDRAVTDVAIYGYSHGGGATFNLATVLAGIVPAGASFTAYIDAVTQDRTTEENRRPLTAFHANYYQPNGLLELGGGPVPGSNVQLDVTTTNWPGAASVDHMNIDDCPQLRGGIEGMLKASISP